MAWNIYHTTLFFILVQGKSVFCHCLSLQGFNTTIHLEIHTFVIMLLLSVLLWLSHSPIWSCSLFHFVMCFIDAVVLAHCNSWQNVIHNTFYFGNSHDMLMFWSYAAAMISKENDKIYSSYLYTLLLVALGYIWVIKCCWDRL